MGSGANGSGSQRSSNEPVVSTPRSSTVEPDGISHGTFIFRGAVDDNILPSIEPVSSSGGREVGGYNFNFNYELFRDAGSRTRSPSSNPSNSARRTPSQALNSTNSGSLALSSFLVSFNTGSPTPLISFTPSNSTSHRPSTSSNGPVNGEDDGVSDNLGDQLGGLRLSTTTPGMDMTSVSNALQAVASGRDSRSGSLLGPEGSGFNASNTPSPRRSRERRRRSSSRVYVPPHDVRDEAPRNDRFNQLAVQNALQNTKRLMRQLTDVLGSSAAHLEPDSVMRHRHEKAQELANFQCPSNRIVALVGDSNAGKSLK